MNLVAIRVLSVLVFFSAAFAQDVIPLYPGAAPGSTQENYREKEYFSQVWNTEVVSNVTKPSLTVYKPAPGTANGNGIVICPGGGFMALSINSEGVDVAKWLAARGMTAFVLKYRLVHTGEDATQEFSAIKRGCMTPYRLSCRWPSPMDLPLWRTCANTLPSGAFCPTT
jgi:hypothetical protein